MVQTLKTTEAGDEAVPLRRQYLQLKARFPDTILLFRLGDFYETFDADAELAARLLDIVLTGRDMGKGKRIPMAGIPYHAAEGYIARLVSAGHKVAVCEQVGSPQKGRGLVERDVTRIVTPGTVLDPLMLDAQSNNFIVAVTIDGKRAGIAVADISTGHFSCTEIDRETDSLISESVERELVRLQPAEILISTDLLPADNSSKPSWLPAGTAVSQIESWKLRVDRAQESLVRHFEVASLDGYGCAGKLQAISAAGALIQYLSETQLSRLAQIVELTTYSIGDFMALDAQTRRNLELTESSRGERRHSLIAVLDQTRTPMGARLLRQWLNRPLLSVGSLKERQDQVEWFVTNQLARGELRKVLANLGDIERVTNRAIAGIASPRDLGTLRSSIAHFPAITHVLGENDLEQALPEVADLRELLEAAIVDEPPALLGKGQVLRPRFSPELDAHRLRAKEARDWIAGLERQERERTGLRSLKVGYNKVFGYYLEISTATLAAAERDRARAGSNGSVLPEDYIPKQTLTNGARYFTPQLKEYETVVLTADEATAELEAATFRRVVLQVADASRRLVDAANQIAQLDVFSTFAEVAMQRNYVRPEIDNGTSIEILEGRHPTLEAILGVGEYVPNNAKVDCERAQIVVLTGPNMAGKSSWLRQVALTVLLAQIGSFVPARSARIGLVDRIFTRIGAHDDITSGQSTFMVEMVETANILNHATHKSLVLLDEIGRGTSTYDGLAIARAIVEYLHNSPRLGSRTLFATHYHELTELERILPRVKCFRMDVHEDGDEVVFLHHVVPGGADRSYGIHVAQLAGVPKGIIRRAQEILSGLETDTKGRTDRDRRGSAMSRALPDDLLESSFQLTLFGAPDPIVEELKQLDVEAMSPLDALTKLYELNGKAKGAGTDKP
ncbi:MAG: DNA mismatch repair protein MutS [Thermomicrobiales bacterium]